MNKKHLRRFASKVLRLVFGLFIFSFGVYLTIQANVGLPPWDCLTMGISYHVPFSFGATHVAISLSIVLLDLLLKEKIGYGTILDALLVGSFVDLFTFLKIVPVQEKLLAGVPILLGGMLIMALGQFFCISSGLGCGPRDAMRIGLGKRVPRFPIGAVEIGILALVLLAAWPLGGPISIGTLIAVLGSGVTMQLVFTPLKFEPRSVRQHSLLETTRWLLKKE